MLEPNRTLLAKENHPIMATRSAKARTPLNARDRQRAGNFAHDLA
jgi:hypothetical protein